MNYIIFDLEATCWKNSREKIQEIIETGAVCLDENLEIVDDFSKYVKPEFNPVLSDFCEFLTSINQRDIESALTFGKVLAVFEKWILSKGDIMLVSWGYFDKKQILRESSAKNYSGSIVELLKEKHISLKHEFAKMRGIKPCGMAEALKILNLPLDGIHHRALDDAKNIAKIFKIIFPELKNWLEKRNRNDLAKLI